MPVRKYKDMDIVEKIMFKEFDRFDRFGICEECNKRRNLEKHHKIPTSVRPDLMYDPENIELVCNECHHKIHGVNLIKENNI